MTVTHAAGHGTAAVAARTYAEVAPPVELAVRAMRLEAFLGDPRDPANPYGIRALTGGARAPEQPAGGSAALLAVIESGDAADDGLGDAEQLARVLRPVFRRDLTLGLACARQLTGPATDGTPGPVADRGSVPDGPLGAAALTAAAGAALRTATGVVVERGQYDPYVRQWYRTLAAAFADLLACEALTVVALRCAGRTREGHRAVAGAAAHLVPDVVSEVLAELELVLTESGCAPGDPERRMLGKLIEDLAGARSVHAAAEAGQSALVAALPALADAATDGGQEHRDDNGRDAALFRLGTAVSAGEVRGDDVLPASLVGASARLTAASAGAGAVSAGAGLRPDTGGLARVARRLVSEQRVLRLPCRRAAPGAGADPAVLALADRQALLLMSAAVLGVRESACADTGRHRSLGEPHWALLALSRVTERLGVPQPAVGADPRGEVWAELVDRGRNAVDCDLYGTRVLW